MTSRPGRLVVAVAGDPGGARAVAPVISELRERGGCEVIALAYNQAVGVWNAHGIAAINLGGEPTQGTIRARLSSPRASLLLCGTSANGIDWEREFIDGARGLGIPSLAVLDFWSNYRRRFTDADGRNPRWPDRIAVMDGRARQEMVWEGFAAERLAVTGQPAFDELGALRESFTPERRAEIRRRLDPGMEATVALFVSQPLAALYGTDPERPGHPGFTETETLAGLTAALAELADEAGRDVTLVVRPHPREATPALPPGTGGRLRVVIVPEFDARELAMSADLVTGMNSVLLLEACHLGCVTLSLQPGLRGADCLPSNAQGLSRPVYAWPQLKGELAALLWDWAAREEIQRRLAREPLPANATHRVARLALEMIQNSVTTQ